MQKNKLCPGCKEIKNVNNFYESPTRKDGLRCYCKTCEKNKNSTRKYYEKSKGVFLDDSFLYKLLSKFLHHHFLILVFYLL